MDEILPGLLHWTAFHEGIGETVHSSYLVRARAVVDPMVPGDEVIAELERVGPPQSVLLSNRHHLRGSARLVEAFGCTVRCHAAGLHEFDDEDPDVVAFAFGDEVAPGVHALELGAICAEETVLHAPALGPGLLSFADGVIRGAHGELAFVPDELLGDRPEAVKAALRARLRELLDYDFDALTFAHGAPMARGGKDALATFAG
jgi:hypothetical protein